MSEQGRPQELDAVLGAGTEYDGKLCFPRALRIDGAFSGEVQSEGTLILGPEASVDATIDVGYLIVLGGELRGKVHATHSVELNAPAKVFADIETDEVFVERGVELIGQCKTTKERPDDSEE